ncbi:NAD(P)-dependent dehydrogenase, short-chain alcohol dehydrogenase family [Singulisphaera sp. GP187]|uniref:3-ketoacyl-ACP reductase n=1 Tax=Singulisphaera sp. GP187 TaxID=1882752 RepID=UPI00092B0F80|nr:3-ketoacyl-ACP reductase [Singulisphaera sp. GP187]SIO64885.1 NAD(P)-dependent dehydrogenase, short-chain alcohol dehydrogenase family [Singulisphaera sp. GP187]
MTVGERVAIVTGGSRGIGRGIVEELSALKYSVVVNYRSDGEAAEATCREAENRGAPRTLAIRADVSDLEAGRAMVERTVAEFGRIDLLVNNAGVAPLVRLDLMNTTAESWDRVLGINLRGPFFLTQQVATSMVDLLRAGTIADPQIIFVTSISSTFASVTRGEYCVSKAGLSMVAQLFATRLADEGIRVNEVRPGIIATDMTGAVRDVYDRRIAGGLVPIRRWGTPLDIGRAVGALAAESFPYTTGEVFHVDGGLHLRRL